MKHSAAAGSERAREAGPERTEPHQAADDLTADEALEVIRGGLGPMKWERHFRHHIGPEGTTIYLDERTGQVYDAIPDLNPSDGRDR